MLLVAVTVGLETHVLTGIDTAVADFFPRHRDPVFPWPAQAGFALGQTWVFPAASALLALLLASGIAASAPCWPSQQYGSSTQP